MEQLLCLLIEFPNILEKCLDTVAFGFINDLTCPLINRFNNSTATFFVSILRHLLKSHQIGLVNRVIQDLEFNKCQVNEIFS